MSNSVLLNREALLKKDELKIEKVELSKGCVYVREMTGREVDLWRKSLMKEVKTGDRRNPVEYQTSLEDFSAKLAVMTVCDENGNLLFKPQDVVTLNGNMSASNLDKIVTVAQKLNGISEEEKDVLLKN